LDNRSILVARGTVGTVAWVLAVGLALKRLKRSLELHQSLFAYSYSLFVAHFNDAPSSVISFDISNAVLGILDDM
jgi:hypothetical protein